MCVSTILRDAVSSVMHKSCMYPIQVLAAIDYELRRLRVVYGLAEDVTDAFLNLCRFQKMRTELNVLTAIESGRFSISEDPYNPPGGKQPPIGTTWDAICLNEDGTEYISSAVDAEAAPIGFKHLLSPGDCSVCCTQTTFAAICCGQAIHPMCMMQWALAKLPSQRTCPTCRGKFKALL